MGRSQKEKDLEKLANYYEGKEMLSKLELLDITARTNNYFALETKYECDHLKIVEVDDLLVPGYKLVHEMIKEIQSAA